MLPKSARPTAKSVHYLMRHGKRRHGQYVSILRIGKQRHSRRGSHIAKKVAKDAVQRNAARRAVFSTIEKHASMLSGGLFFVIINKKNVHLREDLVKKDINNPIFNRVSAAITPDMQAFASSYR